MDAIEAQLSYRPSEESRNRKRMDDNALEAGYELRVGHVRVYYDVDETGHIVSVLAIGTKDRARVRIGGEEVEL